MAGRVNTRFVIILCSTLLLLCVGVGAFYYTFVHKSAGEYVDLGNKHFLLAQDRQSDVLAGTADDDEAVEQRQIGKDYRLAAENYRKALQRDRTNVDVQLKYLDASRRMTVADQYEAQRVLEQIYGLMREATERSRNDPALLERFYQMVYRWAREFGSPRFYADLTTLTANKLQSDPESIPALKFHAMVEALQLTDGMDRSKQQQIKADLETVLEAQPNDTDAQHYLARWYLFDADRLQRARGDAEQIAQRRAKALELAQTAFQANSNNGDVAVEYLDILLMLADSYRQGTRYVLTQAERDDLQAEFDQVMAQAKPVLEGLESYLLGNPDPPLVVQRVAAMLPRLFPESDPDAPAGVNTSLGLNRTERLLRSAVAARPEMLLYQLMLANVLKTQLQLDAAHAVYLKARDQKIEGPAEASLRDEGLRQQAVFEVANIELIRAEAAEDPARRLQILADADKAVNDLETVTGEDSRVLMLRGKIALLRQENTKAMVSIDKAVDLIEAANPASPELVEAYLLSARARQEERQWGAAAQRLEQVLQRINPSARPEAYSSIRLQLAELLIRARRFDVAQAQINAVLEGDPENATALRLRAQWYVAQDKADQAIAILESPQLKDLPAVRQTLAQLYQATGDTARGQDMMREQLAANPGDVRLLRQVLPTIESQEEQLRLIDQAEQAGADSMAIGMLRLQARGEQKPMTIEDVVRQIDEGSGAPLDKALQKSQLYTQTGQFDEARKFFEQAQKIDAKDHRVVLLAMDFAIRDENFDAARQLIAEAGKQNLDMAGGHFLRGKLAAAENNLPQAVASFEQGLKQRPIFSEGWRQFGDLKLAGNDPEAAASAYNTALDQQPDNVQALIGLANAEFSRGRQLQGLEALRTAVQYAPGNGQVVARYLDAEERFGNDREAMRFRRDLAQNQPQNQQNRLNLAILEARAGNLDAGLKILDDIEAESERSQVTVAARATAYAGANQAPEGLALLRNWVESLGEKADTEAYLLLARFTLSAGEPDAAISAYRQAIKLEDPKTRPASRELADTLFNAGEQAESLTLYEDLYRSAEADQKARLGQRLVEALLRGQQAERAQQVLTELPDDATTAALKALLARQQGNTEQALAMINRSLSQDSRSPMSLLQRAELLAADPAKREAALADLDRALSLSPDFVQALALKGNLLAVMGREAEAMRTLRTLLDLAPGNGSARYQLAELYVRNNETDEAQALVDGALKLSEDNPVWLQLQASLAQRQGDAAKTQASLEKLVAAQPEASSVGQLAGSYLAANRAAAAGALLEEHPQLVSNSPALQAIRGRVLAAQQKPEEARRVFELAIQRSTDLETLSTVLGQVSQALGQADAEQLLQQVEGGPSAGVRGLMLARMAMQTRDFAAAIDRVAAARSQASAEETNLILQLDRIEALARYQSGDFEGAKAAYMHLLELSPDDVEVLNNLAYLMANDLNDPQGALPMAERAAAKASNNAEVLDTLGWTYQQVGRTTDARLTLEQSVRLRALPANTLHLGLVYLALNLPDRAREQLQQSLTLAERDGDNDYAAAARRELERLPR